MARRIVDYRVGMQRWCMGGMVVVAEGMAAVVVKRVVVSDCTD